jgi:uncharacterized membrane protein YbhN (UPF0104 family)
MKRWLRLALQLLSLALFGLILVWGGPAAWQQILAGDYRYILASFILMGATTILSATRLQLIARFLAGRDLAPWSRFYYLNMTTRALGLVVPRSLSTIGGKSVALRALGLSLRRGIWTVVLDNAFDLLLLGILAIPALLFLRQNDPTWDFLALCLGLILALVGWIWWITAPGRFLVFLRWLGRIPRLASALHIDPETSTSPLLPRSDALRALGLTAMLNGALTVCFYCVARAVGLAHPWSTFAAGFPVTQLSLVLAVTPGGLGLFDAGWYGVLVLGGVPHQEALIFVIAQRAYIFVFVLVWAGFSVLISLIREGTKRE